MTTPPTHRRVLVVDDNADAADSLSILLRLLGHDVVTAYAGPGGLTLAESFQPEVVFLDIGMPGMSGYEVARLLKAGPAAPGIRLLVAVSGFGQTADHHKAVAAGFDRLLVKPADPAVLAGLLH
jgi:CheY-like chemotaxis protein